MQNLVEGFASIYKCTFVPCSRVLLLFKFACLFLSLLEPKRWGGMFDRSAHCSTKNASYIKRRARIASTELGSARRQRTGSAK